ncbi:MAG TPA: hypothetical protein P5137_14105, partial [Candidatus Brocadiia bacterium]|nr:hypothetical protein [Candidatus Brocadiia bacterium]
MPVRRAILLSFFLASAVLAAPAAVTLDLKNVPLAEALAKFQDVTVQDPSGLLAKTGPVTLAAKDLDADAALYAILRPQGLECVWLADNRVRLYPAESAVGMAKTAGRSLRTFVNLVAKLEKAVSEGDEVRVPDWLDTDDTRLAQ